MIIRHAEATWQGDIKGTGHVKSQSGVLDAPYSFQMRFGSDKGTNPEELIGSAHAACYSMALSLGLASAGKTATRVTTKADVFLDKVGEGFKIVKIVLNCEGVVPGLDDAGFQEAAHKAKTGCPISQALAATPIELIATLVK